MLDKTAQCGRVTIIVSLIFHVGIIHAERKLIQYFLIHDSRIMCFIIGYEYTQRFADFSKAIRLRYMYMYY